MIASIIAELGPWNWMALGLILLTLEIFVPGMFMIWFGVAALITGAISLAIWPMALWTWPIQITVFLALSVACVFAGRKLVRDRDHETDEPLLNNRTAQMVGRIATLDEAIVNGHGRVKIGDTLWRIKGDDAPAGTRVKVAAVERDILNVSRMD